jgi:hypothetical protein
MDRIAETPDTLESLADLRQKIVFSDARDPWCAVVTRIDVILQLPKSNSGDPSQSWSQSDRSQYDKVLPPVGRKSPLLLDCIDGKVPDGCFPSPEVGAYVTRALRYLRPDLL